MPDEFDAYKTNPAAPPDEFAAYMTKAPATAAPVDPNAPPTPTLAPMPNVPGLSPTAPQDPSILDKVLNYHGDNKWYDVIMGAAQGAGKGLISSAYGARDLADKIPGGHQALNAIYAANGISPEEQAQDEIDLQNARKALTTPKGIGQGTGKFAEQVGEYAIPSTEFAKGMEGANLLYRALAQAGVGVGVSGVQSGGDKTAMEIGGAVGAGGELAGAGIGGLKKLLTARAPTFENFADAFKATPGQKEHITNALPLLEHDQVVPAATPAEMLPVVQDRLDRLSQMYKNVGPLEKAKTTSPNVILDALDEAQKSYIQNGVITDQAAYDTIGKQINIVQDMAAAKNGKLSLDNITHLKNGANGKTNFNSPDQDKNLWKLIGNAYRTGEDDISPITSGLNKDWQKYSDLKEILRTNTGQGKGSVQSGLDALMKFGINHGISGVALGALGHALFGDAGAALGTIIGGYAGPKVGNAIYQAGKNVIESPAGVKVGAAMGSDAGTLMKRAGQGIAQKALQPNPIVIKH